jgi:hypothetical protein
MAAAGFVKIYGSKLITSSLWDEPPEVRLVFMAFLAISDWDGFVDIPNERALARVMNLEIDYLERALSVLTRPDKGSRTPDREGIRVFRDGTGWRVVNYEKYREFRSSAQEATRLRVERYRAKSSVTSNGGNVHVSSVTADTDQEEEQEREEDHISESPATSQTKPAEPALLVFPCNGKVKEWRLTQTQVDEWSALFVGVDVMDQCRRALAWVKAKGKKTAKGMPKFLVGWLGRTNDRGGSNGKARGQEIFETNRAWAEGKR